MDPELPLVRAAAHADLAEMAAMAALLVRFHHALDERRFFLARGVEAGYRDWFARELARPEAILLVAERDGVLEGYCYGRIEARDWNMLLDRHAALHDVFVRDRARKGGAGAALVSAFLERARAKGAPRAVLSTATQNTGAQRLFARLGFRPTMIEMTCELPRDQE